MLFYTKVDQKFGPPSDKTMFSELRSNRTLTPIIALVFTFIMPGCPVQLSHQVPKNQVLLPNSAQSQLLQPIDCDTLIIGGGMGGVYTAFQLGKHGTQSVCLFELEPRLGGRILDVSFDGTEKSPRIGVGARRILNGQVLFALTKELGIDHNSAAYRDDLIFARGQHAWSKDKLAKLAYPGIAYLDKTPKDESEVEDALYERIQPGTNLRLYPDFPSFVRANIGAEGYHYLVDVSRFRSDFQYPIDTKSYLDWLKEELIFDSAKPVYPVGGMSEFIKRMALSATAKGVRIFTSQPIKTLSRNKSGYEAITPSYQVTARKVIIAVNAANLKLIRGDVADSIVSSPQYRQLFGVPVVTVTQWWSKPWWIKAYANKDVRRIWTTDHCLNFMEIPADKYGSQQLVTRTVYSDEMACVALWQQLYKISTKAVEAEIDRELHEIFPGVGIPHPLKTFVKVWPDAWYWLKAGSPFTNCDIANWATKPIPGDSVYLVGESYNPQRSTWSDGAVNSSIATLNAGFGFNLPHAAPGSVCRNTPGRQ